MNKKAFVAMAAGALLGGTAVYTVTAQEYGDNAETDMEAMMQAWLDAGTPGAEHAELAKSVGTFSAQGTSYAPDASITMEWEGTVERKTIFDGRYILEHYEIENMEGFGSFEGYGLLGFNNLTGEYEGTWIDSLSTMIFVAKGQMDPSSNNLVMYGTRMDPISMQNQKTKSVTTINDDGSFVLDMYVQTPEGMYKEMTLINTPKELENENEHKH